MKEKIPSSKGGQAKIILPRLLKQALKKTMHVLEQES